MHRRLEIVGDVFEKSVGCFFFFCKDSGVVAGSGHRCALTKKVYLEKNNPTIWICRGSQDYQEIKDRFHETEYDVGFKWF